MERWKSLPAQYRRAILIAWPVLVIGAFGYLTWGNLLKLGKDPALNSVSFLQRENKKSLYTQIADTQDKIDIELEVIAERPEVEARLAEINEQKEALEQRLPNTKQKEAMRRRIQEMANEAEESGAGSVSFIGVTIDEPPISAAGGRRGRGKQELYQEITYKCELKADLNGLIYYIHTVESNPRFMSVRRIDIKPGDVTLNAAEQTIDRNLHGVSLDIVTYVLLDEDSNAK